MMDFLSGFNFGAQPSARSSDQACGSVDDLALRFWGLLETNATPNRAEHVSTTLELGATAQFTLSVSEQENNALENLTGADRSMEDVISNSIHSNQAEGQIFRTVGAKESLMNQPHDDPILQRAVAKHIISTLSATDGSTWVVREVSRGAQGWNLTYICQHSHQQWNRQNMRNPRKAVIGEYSLKEPDPILSNRPAFDCRGSIVIAFNKDGRAISIKYDHTPMHKTVAELAADWKPPPRVLGPRAQTQPKQPKAPKAPKKPRPEKKAQDESGNPRKKRKKANNDEAQAIMEANGSIMALAEYSHGANAPQPLTEVAQGHQPQIPQPYQESLGGAQMASGDVRVENGASQPPSSVTVPVNVSATEAARRRDVATVMLRDAGVDPASLSADQFSIFSNQAPDLQKESLAMLVKYGAERLRIVHPSNRENLAAAPSSGPTTTTKELVPGSEQSPIASAASIPAVTNNNDSAAGPDGEHVLVHGTPKGRSKMGKSRNACFRCKERKVKCPRERPICTECQNNNLACEFAPPLPRKKKQKKIACQDVDKDATEEDAGQPEEAQSDQEPDVEEQPAAPDSSSYPQLPVANMLTPNTEEPPESRRNAYWRSEHGQNASHAGTFAPLNPSATLPAGAAVSQGHTYSTPPTSNISSATSNQNLQETQYRAMSPQTMAYAEKKRRRAGQASANQTKRRLSMEPPRTEQHSGSSDHQGALNWPAGKTNQVPTATMRTGPPMKASATTAAGDSSQEASQRAIPETIQVNDVEGMQHATALSLAALHQQQSPRFAAATQSNARQSPFQFNKDVPRTKSRQSQRGQTATPVANQSTARGYQPPAAPPAANQSYSNTWGNENVVRGSDGVLTCDYMSYNNANSKTAYQNQPSNRIAYKPYSEQQQEQMQASTRQTRSHSSLNTAVTNPMTLQAPSSVPTAQPVNVSTSNQWQSPQTRGRSTYSNAAGSISQASKPGSAQNVDTRASTQSRTQPSSNQYGQQPQHGYSSYPSQTQQSQEQTSSQQSNWFNFHSANNGSFTLGSSSAGYSWKMSEDSW